MHARGCTAPRGVCSSAANIRHRCPLLQGGLPLTCRMPCSVHVRGGTASGDQRQSVDLSRRPFPVTAKTLRSA